MRKKPVLRCLAALLMLDGLSLLIAGRAYGRLWDVVPGPAPYRQLTARFSRLPSIVQRSAGLAELALGLALLARARFGVEELYQRWSAFYDAIASIWRWQLFPDAQRAFDQALGKFLPPGGRVLDLGCGTGANLGRLLALNLPFAAYVGVDQSEAMLNHARAELGDVERASFLQLDLTADPLPEGPFDLVVSSWVFSHLAEPGKVVDKAMGRLVEGGHAVLLFLAESGGWSDWLVDPFLAFFSARGVRRETYLEFSGAVCLERFFGGHVAAMVLKKTRDASFDAACSS